MKVNKEEIKEGQMYCAIIDDETNEVCGRVDDTHSSYCIKHGRSVHRIKEEEKIENWTCSVCGKEYETYTIFLTDNMLSIASELKIRDKYYNSKLKKGLCNNCRGKEYDKKK